jgi:hypothetical protein
MRRLFTVLLFLGLMLIANCEISHASIVLNDGGMTNLNAVVRDRDVAFPANTIETFLPLTLPFVDAHTATVGASTNSVQYDLSPTGFQISNQGARAGSLDSFSTTHGIIYFSVTVDTIFDLSAHFAATDPTAKFVELSVALTDLTSVTTLFQNVQSSFGVIDEEFTLGESGGNLTNILSGSLTGTLLAGHQFQLEYNNSLYASNAGGPASAEGTFQISFAPAPNGAVPEPGQFFIWGSLAACSGLGAVLRRRSHCDAVTNRDRFRGPGNRRPSTSRSSGRWPLRQSRDSQQAGL